MYGVHDVDVIISEWLGLCRLFNNWMSLFVKSLLYSSSSTVVGYHCSRISSLQSRMDYFLASEIFSEYWFLQAHSENFCAPGYSLNLVKFGIFEPWSQKFFEGNISHTFCRSAMKLRRVMGLAIWYLFPTLFTFGPAVQWYVVGTCISPSLMHLLLCGLIPCLLAVVCTSSLLQVIIGLFYCTQ